GQRFFWSWNPRRAGSGVEYLAPLQSGPDFRRAHAGGVAADGLAELSSVCSADGAAFPLHLWDGHSAAVAFLADLCFAGSAGVPRFGADHRLGREFDAGEPDRDSTALFPDAVLERHYDSDQCSSRLGSARRAVHPGYLFDDRHAVDSGPQ